MRAIIIFISTLLILSSCVMNSGDKKPVKGDEYYVYYLGGQSNMEGYGYADSLKSNIISFNDSVPIFHGTSCLDDSLAEGKGIWSFLRPGHGAGFSSNGISNEYSNRFGIELSFAKKLQTLKPGKKIALIKYSRNGSSIDAEAARNWGSWDPDYKDGEGVNQYDHFLATMENAFQQEDINGDGNSDKLIPAGILWMQGESDADMSEDIALRYFDNLTQLISLIRDSFGDRKTPVIIGRISDSGNDPSGRVWEFGDIIRKAQQDFVDNDKHAAIVRSTDLYKYSDPWHYDSEGFIDLGKQFALKLDSLSER